MNASTKRNCQMHMNVYMIMNMDTYFKFDYVIITASAMVPTNVTMNVIMRTHI